MENSVIPEADETVVAGARHHLERTTSGAITRMRFELQWFSSAGRHTDCFVASSIDLRRDILPPEIEPQILGQPLGHTFRHDFAPGELLSPWEANKLFRVRDHRFNRRYMRYGLVQPRSGRFYPKGILEGVDGVSRGDRHPFRVPLAGERDLLVDFNHPLAEKPLRLEVSIEDIWAWGEQTGGRCNQIGDIVCGGGPGMQARWRDQPTDFLAEEPFLRSDPRPDAEFYSSPRFVDHVDTTAIGQITGLYGKLVPRGARVLDLMSSWHSHLPAVVEPERAVGLGMNGAELDANTTLHERVIQDLNQAPELPFADAAFDAVLCTVSVEYLTNPHKVFREVARVLRPGGRFVVTFSNRWFPTKVIRIWEGIHEFERPGLVSEYFLESGLFENLETWSMRGLPRPADDKYADRLLASDPVYAVWAERVTT